MMEWDKIVKITTPEKTGVFTDVPSEEKIVKFDEIIRPSNTTPKAFRNEKERISVPAGTPRMVT